MICIFRCLVSINWRMPPLLWRQWRFWLGRGQSYHPRALPPGCQWLVFARRKYWIDVPGRRENIAEGQTRHPAAPIVMPAADKTVTGRVTDAEGTPMPGVDVQIGHSRTLSDDGGGFRLDSCTGLKQILRASAWVKELRVDSTIWMAKCSSAERTLGIPTDMRRR